MVDWMRKKLKTIRTKYSPLRCLFYLLDSVGQCSYTVFGGETMKTQSADTHPDTERMLIHLIRNAPVSKRFRLIQSLTQGALWSNMRTWRERYPNASEQEAAHQAVSCWYGPVLATRVEVAFSQREPWQLQSVDLLSVVVLVF